MRVKVWQKWLIGIGGALAVVSVGVYYGMNYAVDYTLRSIVPSGSGISKQAEVAAVSPWSDSVKSPSDTKTEENSTVPKGKDSPTEPGKHEGQVEDVKPGSAGPVSTPKQDVHESNASSNPAATPAPAPSKDKPLTYEAQVTQDKAKAVEDSISLKEKTLIASVMLKKLSSTDIQLFMKMAGNGLSLEEKVEAKKVILQKLTEDEYNQLIGIAAKYGLSQGRNYQDSKKEK